MKQAEKAKRKAAKSGMVSQDVTDSAVQDTEEETGSKEDVENEAAENYQDEDEDLLYRVYFRKEEIKTASVSQSRDQFQDIVTMRCSAVVENKEKNVG